MVKNYTAFRAVCAQTSGYDTAEEIHASSQQNRTKTALSDQLWQVSRKGKSATV